MFQFMTATRIIFGEGSLESSLSIISQYGYSVLLVSGKNAERYAPLTALSTTAEHALPTCCSFWRAQYHYG